MQYLDTHRYFVNRIVQVLETAVKSVFESENYRRDLFEKIKQTVLVMFYKKQCTPDNDRICEMVYWFCK
jgi:hypothetical protein